MNLTSTGFRNLFFLAISFFLWLPTYSQSSFTLYGMVGDLSEKNKLGGELIAFDAANGNKLTSVQSDPATGLYELKVSPKKDRIRLEYKVDGYYVVGSILDISLAGGMKRLNHNICMAEINPFPWKATVGEEFRFKDLNFDTDKAIIQPVSYKELNLFSEWLRKNATVRVLIQGHTDSQGSDTYNQGLSDRRVKSVINYLVDKGVAGARLEGIGFGESQPIADNTTVEGRAQNRRVVFKILGK